MIESPRFVCPEGCDLIQQTVVNTTNNVTSRVNRCSCRAGTQPCPGAYTGCVCQPQAPSLQARTAYVVCSSDASQCQATCRLSVGQLGPLCPIVPDSSLPEGDSSNGPYYPRWSWDLAQQGQATAAVAPGTPIGRRLLGAGGVRQRRWSAVAAGVVRRLLRVLCGDLHGSSEPARLHAA